MEARDAVEIRADFGLAGDRHAAPGARGQVTIVSAEELAAAAAKLGAPIPPGSTRRNVTVAGVELTRAKGAVVRLGRAAVEITGPAEPCDVMERSIGPGAKAALVGLAGVRARVLEGGVLRTGDAVTVEGPAPRASPAGELERGLRGAFEPLAE
jgi:MOSC domain-containing protein YiiM